MRINVFEGARRIALLLAVLATAIVLFAAVTYDPYISINYRIYQPNTPFLRTDKGCPTDAGQHYFSTKTKAGTMGINICLMTMPFGKDAEQLVPYKNDRGVVWGAANYSAEVRAYAEDIERRFELPSEDKKWVEDEISRNYRENWLGLLKNLAIGLAVFWMFVWAVGWITRGFAGIPSGKDKRQDN